MGKFDRLKERILSSKTKLKLWQKVVTVLSCFAVFVTVYSLILPAITINSGDEELVAYCGKNEHVHTDECYDVQLTCELEENEEHEHNDNCYKKELVCSNEEHEHTLICYSNKNADRDIDKWVLKTPGILSSNWTKDLLDIANSQVGYNESLLNYTVDEENNVHGYTIYGDWYDDPYSDWNLSFINWCLDLANVPSSLPDNFEDLLPEEMLAAMVYVPRSESVSSWIEGLNNVGLYFEMNKGDYEPAIGEIVFIENNDETIVGIVSNINYTTEEGFENEEIQSFDVILGDYENGVAVVQYLVIDNDVIGCFSLPLNPNYQEAVIPPNSFDESLLGNNNIEDNFDAIAYLEYIPYNQIQLFSSGFNLLAEGDPIPLEMRNFLLKSSKGVVVKYHPAHKGEETQNTEWFDLPTTGTISPDSHFRVEAKYAGVDPVALKKAGYKIKYYPGTQFKALQASGDIKVDGQVRGSVSAGEDENGEYVTLTFDSAWVQSIIDSNGASGDSYKQTIAGDFYFQSSLNLSEIDKDKGHILDLGPIQINLPVSGDASAEFGQLDITKQPLNVNSNGKQEMIKGSDGNYYLKYMITVKTGDDPMQNVVIRDVIGNLNYVNGYVGVNGTKQNVLTAAPTETPSAPYSDGASGQIYLTNNNTTPAKGVTTEFANANDGKYMVWEIGDIDANQTKTLTYYVKVSDSYTGVPHQTNEAIVNTASAYSKGYPHNNRTVSYLPNATAELTKNLEGGKPVNNNDGTYTYNYVLTVTIPESNEYDLRNVELKDSFIERGVTTNYNEFISYNIASVQVFDSDNQLVSTITPNEIESGVGLATGQTATQAFGLYFEDLAPGKTYTIKYSMTLNADQAALRANGNVGIYNRARLTAKSDPTSNAINIATKDQGYAVRNQTWESKSSPGQIREGFTQNVTGNIYDATGAAVTSGLPSTNYNVPAGAFKYVVNINTGSANDFDVSGTQWKDALTNNTTSSGKDILKLVGYMQVDVYSKTGAHKETRWVKIDGNTGYNFNGQDIGLSAAAGDHYTLTYYAVAQGGAGFGIADVNNSFNLSGTVGLGAGSFQIPGFTTTVKSRVDEPGFEVPEKFAWYYDSEDTSFNTNDGYLETGAMYWFIEQGGTFIPNEMKFQESVNYSSYNHFLRKEESFLGFYTVNLEKLGVERGLLTLNEDGSPNYSKADVDKLHISDFYNDYQSFIDDFNSEDCDFISYVPSETYTTKWSSGNNTNGWNVLKGKNYDFNVEFITEYSINSGEKLYLLIRTEPKELPAEDTTIRYDNKVNYLGPNVSLINGNWPNKQASQTLYGPHGSLEKTSDGLFRVTTNADSTKLFEKWNAKEKSYEAYDPSTDNKTFSPNVKVDSESAFVYNNGVYVAWNITINKLGEIDNLKDGNGDYTIIDSLPSGVELAYVRGSYINQTHVKTGRFFGESAPYNFSMENVKFSTNEGWTSHNAESVLIGSDNNNLWNTKYYTRFHNGENQIGIYVPNIYGASDGTGGFENRINFQIICRVTDPNIYMQDVTFANVATLFNKNGQEIESDTSIVKAYNGNLSKTDLSKYANSSNEMQVKIPYSIVINEEEADMESDTNILSVGLVDHMSKNLAIDMDSLRIYLNYKDLSNPGTLVYDGGVDKTNVYDGSSKVYYATDAYGNKLYWQQEAVVKNGNKDTTPFATTGGYASSGIPVISTIKKSNLDVEKIEYGEAGDISTLYYVGVGLHDEYTYGTIPEISYEYIKSLSEVTSGNYKIQVARPGFSISGHYASGTITSGGMDVVSNSDDAYVFKFTRVNDEIILIQNNDNQYLKMSVNNNISYSDSADNLKIVENTDGAYASTKAEKLAIGLGAYNLETNYLNLNNASRQLKHWSLDVGSAVYLLKEERPNREITSHSDVAASNKLYWNKEATFSSTRSDYPVLTTGDNRPSEVNGKNVVWHEMTYDSGNTVIGNIDVTDNDFQLKDNEGRPLFFEQKKEDDNWVFVTGNDGLKKMVIESEKNSDTNNYQYIHARQTQIVIAVEDYYDEFGVTDGSKVVKFYNLPDSVSIGIIYDVNASISSYSNQSYSNETYWENYDKSEGGSTDSGEMQYTAGGNSQVVKHGAVKITKYNGADTSIRLQNAEFTLYRAKYVTSSDEYNYVAIKDETHVTYKLDSAYHEHEHSHPAIFRVDANGNHVEEMITVRATDQDPDGHVEGELLGFLTGGSLNETTKLYEGGTFIDISSATGTYEHQLYVNPETGKLEVDYTNGHGQTVSGEKVAWIKRTYKQQGSDKAILVASEHVAEPTTVSGCVVTNESCRVDLPDSDGYTRFVVYTRTPGALGVDLTNSSGVATYGFADDQTAIHYNKVYAIVETVAPEGFDVDPSPHFFVVPSENESGQGENYFFHSNESDFPEDVHIVRMSEGGVLTYYLNVYDYKANIQVKKAFGGNGAPESNHKPGTYTFGIWDSNDVMVDENGNTLLVDASKRIEIGRITYVEEDFGYYTLHPTDSQYVNWSEFKTENGQWFIRLHSYSNIGVETIGSWSAINGNKLPSDATYGVLPNRNRYVTFKDLSFDHDYYVYELDKNLYPIINSGETVDGNVFDVVYGSDEPIYIPNSNPQKLVVEGNRVTTYRSVDGTPMVPILIATNRSYSLTVNKSFITNEGIVINEGVSGSYSFGIWKQSDWTKDEHDNPIATVKDPFDIKTIEWSQASKETVKTVVFDNLTPGDYYIFELDDDSKPILNNSIGKSGGKNFSAGYEIKDSNGQKIVGNGITIGADDDSIKEIDVTNKVYYVTLPYTGGIGNYTYLALCTLFTSVSICVYALKKRNSKKGGYFK